MALDPEELGVEINQIFTDAAPDLAQPVLRTVLIGEHFQIETDLSLGDYSGALLALPYPSLILGAEVDTASVEISLTDPLAGQVDLVGGGTDFTANTSSISINASIAKTLDLVQSDVGVSWFLTPQGPNAIEFVDTSVDFIAAGVLAGDTLVIAAPSANASTYTIQNVIDQNSLTLVEASPSPSDLTGESYTISGSRAVTGPMLISYKARRNDLVGQLRLIERRQDRETIAGIASTENPLGLAAALHELAAPTTAYYVTAIAADTALQHQQVLDELEEQPVYSLVPLHQNDDVLDITSLYETHVCAESDPGKNAFRVAWVSRDVPTLLTRVASKTAPTAGAFDDTAAGPNEIILTDAAGDFLANGVEVGDVLKITAATPSAAVGEYLIKDVTATTVTVIGTVVGLPTTVAPVYEITTQNFTLADQADFMKDYAEGYSKRRIMNTVAGRGEIQTTLTGSEWIPSFYANVVHAALTSRLAPQQGFSRLTLPGITAIRNPSAGKFRRSDLNTIGSGGNWIIEQTNEAAGVRVRRQNTTDKSTAYTTEFSITKIVDYVSFVYLGALEPFIGQYNIVPSFFSAAQAVLDSVRYNLTSNEFQGIGPVLLSADVVSFEPVDAELGTVKLVIDIDPPFPVNKITLDLIV